MAMKPDEQMTETQLVLEVGHLRRRIRQAEEMVANVVEHCYQPKRLHCSACDQSLAVALEVLR